MKVTLLANSRRYLCVPDFIFLRMGPNAYNGDGYRFEVGHTLGHLGHPSLFLSCIYWFILYTFAHRVQNIDQILDKIARLVQLYQALLARMAYCWWGPPIVGVAMTWACVRASAGPSTRNHELKPEPCLETPNTWIATHSGDSLSWCWVELCWSGQVKMSFESAAILK